MAFNNVRSKLARAIAAYLISQNVGSPADTSAANVTSLSTYPRTTIRPGIAKPEVQLTGLYRVNVLISVKGSATRREDGQDPRKLFDDRVSSVFDAMMQSDDGETLHATASAITAAGRALAVAVDDTDEAQEFAANNADMADFTCNTLYGGGFGEGEADADGCDWEEVLIFDAVCCGSNVD